MLGWLVGRRRRLSRRSPSPNHSSRTARSVTANVMPTTHLSQLQTRLPNSERRRPPIDPPKPETFSTPRQQTSSYPGCLARVSRSGGLCWMSGLYGSLGCVSLRVNSNPKPKPLNLKTLSRKPNSVRPAPADAHDARGFGSESRASAS